MDNTTSNTTLLPYIMEMLSREKDLCTTFDELTEAMKDAVLEEHIRPFGSLDMAVKFSLEVGSNLGIISLSDETVPMPFNFRESKPSSTLRITAAQGRKVIKKALAKPKTRAAKPRPKPKSKAKACAGKRPVMKVAGGKQRLSYKVGRPGPGKTRKLTKPKQKNGSKGNDRSVTKL